VEEIGAMAVYLCSEEAGFITGTDILIDGGWTAR
jgi:NAD(P)-dependent dehydrogenase (short-subunit alcohol dehydrogenase family)